jgi:serine phosphatase RsbU (regulator of sigma subunit)
VLAIVTDGLTEASDENEQELGLEPLKTTLLESADAPLAELMDALRRTSLNRGKQVDDQTVLLVRRDGPRDNAAFPR